MGLNSIVEALRAAGPELDPCSTIESIEVAVVDDGEGLVLQWSQVTADQGLRQFGLVATTEEIERLASTNAGLFRLSDLHLMLVEPHGTSADAGTRTWFRSVSRFSA